MLHNVHKAVAKGQAAGQLNDTNKLCGDDSFGNCMAILF